MASNTGKYRVLSGYCPDQACRTKLFFPMYDSSIECSNCGQRHEQRSLRDISEVTNPNVALDKILRNILFGNKKPKKGPDSVKVLGFSNYECKILSPLLTRYGMDKTTGKARLLSELGKQDIFDCGVLGDRAFLIEPDQMEVSGYGRDHTGSVTYLRETLEAIKKSNNNEECLLPIHADGDGHCLVHAVSRALIGRELFWHALRTNVKEHFQRNLEKYKQIFSDFVDSSEWNDIIDECDPDFVPRDGEPMGLRNIHIFGLANVLRRPIILLDSITGIQSSADYTGVFLPGLVDPEKCRDKDGQRNKPLCLAWSSNGHNHYIALVGVKGRVLPRLPGWMMPKSWGMPQELIHQYIDLDQDQGCIIGGSKCLGDRYILRLVNAMEEVFREKYDVSASLVADVNQYIFKSTGLVSVAPEVVTRETAVSVREDRLYQCFNCQALSQHSLLPEWFQPDGRLYQLAVKTHGKLDSNKHYSFPVDDIVCSYNETEDCLVPDMSRTRLSHCTWCRESKMRLVRADGSMVYINGDRTRTATQNSKCSCGYKHYWDGVEYDNLPAVFPVKLEWGGKTVTENVVWFQDESDPALNSNAFELAQKLVRKHFPGEFGSERLEQKVADRILKETAEVAENRTEDDDTQDKENQASRADPVSWDEMAASKIILTGQAKQTLHKEELTKSNAEKELRQRIETKAGQTQRRRTMEEAERPVTVRSPSKVSPKQQKTGASSQQTKETPLTVEVMPGSAPSQAPSTVSPRPSPQHAGQGVCRVRVTTSDGRQTQLTLEAGTTYSGLQELLASHLQVPVNRQRIKVGFPPRELRAPQDGEPDSPLPLCHGDRVTLEVLPDISLPDIPMVEPTRTPPGSPTEKLMQSITALQADSTDSIDRTITSLTLLAGLVGPDLWTQVQTMPALFERGGAFYEQVKRDLTLVANKHCTLPSLPGKVFRYNATEDVLELCLEPHGHFRVEPGIEDRILHRPAGLADPVAGSFTAGAGPAAFAASPASLQAALKSGSHGVRVDPKMNYQAVRHVPFSGRGQTMASSSSSTRPGPPVVHPLVSGFSSTQPSDGQSREGQYCDGQTRDGQSRIGQSRIGQSSDGQTREGQCHNGQSRDGQSRDRQSCDGQPRDGQSRDGQSRDGQTCGAVPMETDQQTEKATPEAVKEDPLFRRVGPGCRVLETRSQNEANTTIARLVSVAKALETVPQAGGSALSEEPQESKAGSLQDRAHPGAGDYTAELQVPQQMDVEQVEPVVKDLHTDGPLNSDTANRRESQNTEAGASITRDEADM